jgi:hypothetical protein
MYVCKVFRVCGYRKEDHVLFREDEKQKQKGRDTVPSETFALLVCMS